nr:kinesin-like protein KIF26B [Lytechinus pictus]
MMVRFIQESLPSLGSSINAMAAQKLNLSSKKKRKGSLPTMSTPEPPMMMMMQQPPEQPIFPTNFSSIILRNPPPAPPSLLRNVNRVKENPGIGKVREALGYRSFTRGAFHETNQSLTAVISY